MYYCILCFTYVYDYLYTNIYQHNFMQIIHKKVTLNFILRNYFGVSIVRLISPALLRNLFNKYNRQYFFNFGDIEFSMYLFRNMVFHRQLLKITSDEPIPGGVSYIIYLSYFIRQDKNVHSFSFFIGLRMVRLCM